MEISKLMQIKWWDWDLEKILANHNFFSISLNQLQLMNIDEIEEIII